MAKYKRLVLDAGHGGSDSGATGYGDTERESMGALANAINKEATSKGIKVFQIKNDLNTYQTNYYGTTNDIKTTDAIIELHRDGSTNTSASGGSVLISSKYPANDMDYKVAEAIKSYFGSDDFRGIVKRDDLANVNRCAARGFDYRLAELGFISNPSENALLDEQDEYEKFAKLLIEKVGYLFEGYSKDNGKVTYSMMKVFTQYGYNKDQHAGSYTGENGKKLGFYYTYYKSSKKTKLKPTTKWKYLYGGTNIYYVVDKAYLYKDKAMKQKVLDSKGNHKYMPKDAIVIGTESI